MRRVERDGAGQVPPADEGGSTALQAGTFRALPMPMARTQPNSASRDGLLDQPTTRGQHQREHELLGWRTISRRRRSRASAMSAADDRQQEQRAELGEGEQADEDAGAGELVGVRARAPRVCIHVPMFDANDPSHISRNDCDRRAPHGPCRAVDGIVVALGERLLGLVERSGSGLRWRVMRGGVTAPHRCCQIGGGHELVTVVHVVLTGGDRRSVSGGHALGDPPSAGRLRPSPRRPRGRRRRSGRCSSRSAPGARGCSRSAPVPARGRLWTPSSLPPRAGLGGLAGRPGSRSRGRGSSSTAHARRRARLPSARWRPSPAGCGCCRCCWRRRWAAATSTATSPTASWRRRAIDPGEAPPSDLGLTSPVPAGRRPGVAQRRVAPTARSTPGCPRLAVRGGRARRRRTVILWRLVAIGGVALMGVGRRRRWPAARAAIRSTPWCWPSPGPLTVVQLVGGPHNEALMVGLMACGLALGTARRPGAGRWGARRLCAPSARR